MCHLLTRYQSTIFPNHKSCVRKKGVPSGCLLFLFFLAAAGRCGSEFAAQPDRETVTVHAGEADRKERRRGSVGAGKVAQPRFVARLETEAAPAEGHPDAQADIRAAHRAFGGVEFRPAVVVAELAADARAVPRPDGGNDRERA